MEQSMDDEFYIHIYRYHDKKKILFINYIPVGPTFND